MAHYTSTSFLYVPSFRGNLLSMSKLTKDLNRAVTFFYFHCEFGDLSLGGCLAVLRSEMGYIISLVLVPRLDIGLLGICLCLLCLIMMSCFRIKVSAVLVLYVWKLCTLIFLSIKTSDLPSELYIYAKQSRTDVVVICGSCMLSTLPGAR